MPVPELPLADEPQIGPSVRDARQPGRLSRELVAQHLPEAAQPNAWYAPGFAPVSEFKKMLQTLQGAGGVIEQTHLYFDHSSALDWMSIAAQQDYADAHQIGRASCRERV